MSEVGGRAAGGHLLVKLRRVGACLVVAAALGGCASGGDGSGSALCPGTPAGIPVDPDGCPLYSDADAVPDYRDKCPGTAAGITVDSSGCPLDATARAPGDADADGVANDLDACADTPVGARVDARGCSLAGERIAIITNINFDFDRTNVRNNVKKRLSRVIQLLRERPELDVQVVGYTDDVGSLEYNLALSLRRAESVRSYIIAQGIDGARLSVAGRGMSDPLVPNATPEGRAVNRRVEFVVQ